jgi:hypothetical protein
MKQQNAERAGTEPAEGTSKPPTIIALQIFGPNGWRERNAQLYQSDASARWCINQHRAELIEANAMILVAGRLVALLPKFDELMVQFGRDALIARMGASAQAADAAVKAALATAQARAAT